MSQTPLSMNGSLENLPFFDSDEGLSAHELEQVLRSLQMETRLNEQPNMYGVASKIGPYPFFIHLFRGKMVDDPTTKGSILLLWSGLELKLPPETLRAIADEVADSNLLLKADVSRPGADGAPLLIVKMAILAQGIDRRGLTYHLSYWMESLNRLGPILTRYTDGATA